MRKRAVFLDRDGVLNRAIVRNGKPYPPDSVDQLEIVPEAAESLGQLKQSGFVLIVVTNQPDVARGTQTRAAVEAIHARIQARIPSIDAFYVCYHDDKDGCHCRKPKPGLMTDAADDWLIDLGSSYLIGDRYRDVEAAHAAGCTAVWIDYGYAEREPKKAAQARVKSLSEAVEWILERESSVRS